MIKDKYQIEACFEDDSQDGDVLHQVVRCLAETVTEMMRKDPDEVEIELKRCFQASWPK